MKYIANPVEVEAHIIIDAGEILPDGTIPVKLQDFTVHKLDQGMLSRYVPKPGDYYVIIIQSDGYIYINPKEVFESKYHPKGKDNGA